MRVDCRIHPSVRIYHTDVKPPQQQRKHSTRSYTHDGLTVLFSDVAVFLFSFFFIIPVSSSLFLFYFIFYFPTCLFSLCVCVFVLRRCGDADPSHF